MIFGGNVFVSLEPHLQADILVCICVCSCDIRLVVFAYASMIKDFDSVHITRSLADLYKYTCNC